MAHAATRRRRLSGNKPDHGLRYVALHELRRLLLIRATDLPDHDDSPRFGIGFKGGETVDEVCADERIAADSHARRLPHPMSRELMDDFVSQRAAARH